MYICEHCGRHLKKKYENCPACGGTTFKKVQNIGEVVIKEPPEGGYHVNVKNFQYEKKGNWPGIILGLWVLLIGSLFCIPFFFTSSDGDSKLFDIFFIIMGLFFAFVIFRMAFIFFGISHSISKKSNTDIKNVKELAKHGILIKNLKYKIKPVAGTIQGNKTTYQIQVLYEIEKGKTKCFESEPKYLTSLGRDDGTVDLLIDPNDYTNYFIDFEIY